MAKRQVLVICLSIAATLVPQSRLRLASDSRSTGLGGTMPEQKVRILKEYPDVFWFVRPEGYLRANPSGPGIGRNQALKMKRSGRKVLLPKALDVPATLPKASGNLPFIGAEACGECHREKYEGFLRTAHHHTSREASQESILGDFEESRNQLKTGDPSLFFRMEKEGNEFYQRLFVKFRGQIYRHSQRIDLVTGSGNHGQSYLYWQGDELYQMPVSYFREIDRWVNSPAYWDGTADFARPIRARCLDCHATYFENIVGTVNQYRKDTYFLGVSCERCHGPGREHANSPDRSGQGQSLPILHPGRFSRDRLTELCAQCHSGVGIAIRPSFSYRPGEPLNEYVQLDHSRNDVEGGVHTDDQLARLKLSRCFRESRTMTCVTCHDPHQQERGNRVLFSNRCQRCHEPRHCGLAREIGPGIGQNCIDCHMLSQRDRHLKMQTTGSRLSPLLRDHFIARWPQVSQRLLEEIQDKAGSPASP
jgi:hypothetical protein